MKIGHIEKIEIVNQLGEIVYSEINFDKQNIHSIFLDHVSIGVYIINLFLHESKYSKKIIKIN